MRVVFVHSHYQGVEMSKLEKICIVAWLILTTVLSVAFLVELTRSYKLESQNKALQAKNIALQSNDLLLKSDVKSAEQKSARLVKKVKKLESTYWDQRSQVSTLQNRVADLRRGLLFWEANYDMMATQNFGHSYRSWPFDLREQLLGALSAMAQLGPEGHSAASQRFTVLKTQVESAVQAGLGYGWETQSLADFQAKL